jgi:SAM-dependent methyltransferase
MPPLDPADQLGTLPLALRGPILACARGEVPANIALMHLCLAAPDADTLARAVSAAASPASAPLTELARLWRETPGGFDTVKRMARTVDHGETTGDAEARLQAYAAAFDRAASVSPEASVALYSLGNAELLAAATEEIALQLKAWGLLGRERTALEIGCGNGRFLEALAPHLRHIVGIDISAAMIAAARERCRETPNAEAILTGGRDLGLLPTGSLDLVLAIDSFPYIVRCGEALVRRHFDETARVLGPGGHMLILNYAYGSPLQQHRAEIASHAEATGLVVLRDGTQNLRLWDGVAFLLRKEIA